jgi:hypothetical protein
VVNLVFFGVAAERWSLCRYLGTNPMLLLRLPPLLLAA